MDETEYLLSSENNRESLMRSISQAKGSRASVEDIDSIEPVIDSDTVIKMMDNMSISELKMLKATCAVLINFKLNESMSKQSNNKDQIWKIKV